MKQELLQNTIKSELDSFLPRGRKGSIQNKLRLYYSYYRRMDLADGSPEGPEAILEKSRKELFGEQAKQKVEELIENKN